MMIARNNAMRLALHCAFEDTVVVRIWTIIDLQGWSDTHRNVPEWTASLHYQGRRPFEFLAQHLFHL
jgi:hypothetical protein